MHSPNRWLQVLGIDERPPGERLVLLLTYLAGLMFWANFFHFGALDFDFEDWPKEHLYLEILQQAVTQVEIPFHTNVSVNSERFLGIPEVLIAPQILLLPILGSGGFVLVNVCLLYSAGFVGLLLLAKEAKLSLPGTLFLAAVTFFSGYLSSRLAVGHFMWSPLLLSPWFLLLLHRLESRPPILADSLFLAFWVFVFFMHGGFVVLTFWGIFWALYGIGKPSRAFAVYSGLALGCLLSACRLVPAAIAMGHVRRDFIGGYPSLQLVLEGLTSSKNFETARVVLRGFPVGWWEFDTYVGWPAAIWLALGCAVFAFSWRSLPAPQRYSSLALPLLGLMAISWGDVYLSINLSPIPMLSAHRMLTRPSHMIVVLLAFVLVRHASLPNKTGLRLNQWLWLVVPVTGYLLWQHAELWNLGMLEATHPSSSYFPYLGDLANLQVQITHPDRERVYKLGTLLSYGVSLAAFCATVLAWRRARTTPMTLAALTAHLRKT